MEDPISNKDIASVAITNMKRKGFVNIGDNEVTLEDLLDPKKKVFSTLDMDGERKKTDEYRKYESTMKKERESRIKLAQEKKKKKKQTKKHDLSDDREIANISSDEELPLFKKSRTRIEQVPSDSDSAIESIKKKEKKKAKKKKIICEKSMRKKDNAETKDLTALIEPYMMDNSTSETLPNADMWISKKNPNELAIGAEKDDKSDMSVQPLHNQKYYYANGAVIPFNAAEPRTSNYSTQHSFEQAINRNRIYSMGDMSYLVEKLKKYSTSYAPVTQEEVEENSTFDTFISTRQNDQLNLHSKLPGQFECMNEDQCVNMRISKKPLCEHITPEDIMARAKTDAKIRKKPCIRCIRHMYAYVLLNLRAECRTLPKNINVMSYGNIVDAEDQYIMEQCIMTGSKKRTQGVLFPIPLDVDNYYTVEDHGGVVYLSQTGYYTPEQITKKSRMDF